MINISKLKYPLLEFNKGDATNIMIYPAHTFTHITCLNDTIYYFKDKKHLIKNIYEWLMPGGYFILQLDSNQPKSFKNPFLYCRTVYRDNQKTTTSIIY